MRTNRGDFQQQIEEPANFDLVICILWSRLGSRLHPGLHARQTSRISRRGSSSTSSASSRRAFSVRARRGPTVLALFVVGYFRLKPGGEQVATSKRGPLDSRPPFRRNGARTSHAQRIRTCLRMGIELTKRMIMARCVRQIPLLLPVGLVECSTPQTFGVAHQ
jgi:hypothetical protein